MKMTPRAFKIPKGYRRARLGEIIPYGTNILYERDNILHNCTLNYNQRVYHHLPTYIRK